VVQRIDNGVGVELWFRMKAAGEMGCDLAANKTLHYVRGKKEIKREILLHFITRLTLA
jgi:hypothetical protein